MASALTTARRPTSGEPMTVIQLHGKQDTVCPYEGGESVTGHTFMPAEDSIKDWADYNGCTSQTSSETASGNVRIEYTGCTSGVGVVHYGFPEAGHGIPRTEEGGLFKLIWAYFVEHESE